MYNVDTITLYMSTKRFFTLVNSDGKKQRRIDRIYTDYMTLKMMNKLRLTEKSKKNREREKRYNRLSNYSKEVLSRMTKKSRKKININWYGSYRGYNFNFNETWSSLTIMLSHNNVEKYTADEIIENTKKVIIEYFNLEPECLNEITLNRLDIHCDYRYEDEEELAIIKNILEYKASNKIYTYKKRPKKDNSKCYIYTYSAIRKDNREDTAVMFKQDIKMQENSCNEGK